MKTLKGYMILLLLLMMMMMMMMMMTMTMTILMILMIRMMQIDDYDRFQRTDSYDQYQICVLGKAAGIPRSELYITSKVAELGIVGGIVVAGFHRMAYLFWQKSWFRREIAQIFSSEGSMLRKNNDDK